MCLRVTFRTQLPSHCLLKILKVLSLILNQCFGPFTMLPLEGSSQAGAFRHLSNYVLRGRYIRKYISYEGNLFLEMFEI